MKTHNQAMPPSPGRCAHIRKNRIKGFDAIIWMAEDLQRHAQQDTII
jgi:hypothetical protein